MHLQIIPLWHGPAKVGQPGLATVSVHMVVIIIASARMLRKCLRWRQSFIVRFSLFWLCCGCVEGTKYGNGHYYPGKHQIDCAFFGLLRHRRNSRHFYIYLLRCTSAAFLRKRSFRIKPRYHNWIESSPQGQQDWYFAVVLHSSSFRHLNSLRTSVKLGSTLLWSRVDPAS